MPDAELIHLDANFLIKSLASRTANPAFENWARRGMPIRMSAVAWAEFRCGPLSATQAEWARAFLERIEVLTAADAEMAAQLFNETGRRSRSLQDCMIAAVAVRTSALLATLNTADFRQFERFGLRLAR